MNRIKEILQNPEVNDHHTTVITHRGIDICTLKVANPSQGDYLGYVIDHNYFMGKKYEHPDDAMQDIDESWHYWNDEDRAAKSDYIQRS